MAYGQRRAFRYAEGWPTEVGRFQVEDGQFATILERLRSQVRYVYRDGYCLYAQNFRWIPPRDRAPISKGAYRGFLFLS